MRRKVAIVGSGFLGLTLALRFEEQGWDVTLFEAASEIGGLASAWQIGDVVWDRHYHVTLLSDSFTRKMVREAGLEDDFRWVRTKTGFYAGGKLYSLSNAFEFLRFPLLGLVGKLRLGVTIFYASRIRDWRSLEKISVEDWLTKLSGKRTFRKIWLPLLKAKLGEAYKETSAAFIWATIQRMYAARRSGMKVEMFGYVKGGYANVLGRFEEVLRKRGIEVRCGMPVRSVTKQADGTFRITAGADGENGPEEAAERFEKVVISSPSAVAAAIAVELGEDEKQALRDVRYQGIVCASVLTVKPISEFYVTNIIDDSPFTGVIEMTAMVDPEEVGGRHLIYLPKYVAPDDPLFEKTDDEIEEEFLGELERMYPDFSRSDVEAFRVSKVRKVFPLPVLDYSEKLPSMKTSVDGLYIVNSSHIVNGTLNVNETVGIAEKFFREHFPGVTADENE